MILEKINKPNDIKQLSPILTDFIVCASLVPLLVFNALNPASKEKS